MVLLHEGISGLIQIGKITLWAGKGRHLWSPGLGWAVVGKVEWRAPPGSWEKMTEMAEATKEGAEMG